MVKTYQKLSLAAENKFMHDDGIFLHLPQIRVRKKRAKRNKISALMRQMQTNQCLCTAAIKDKWIILSVSGGGGTRAKQ